MSTGNKARHRMFGFVAIIFAAGIVIAGGYIILAKPGESTDKPVSEVVNPSR